MKANKREEKSDKELDSAVYSLIANSQPKGLRKKRDTTGSSSETEAEWWPFPFSTTAADQCKVEER